MTVAVRVRVNDRAMRRDLRRVRGSIVPRVTARALNRAARSTRTQATREIGREFRIKAKLIRDRIALGRAVFRDLTARIFAIIAPLPMILLNPRQTRSGVSARGGHQVPGGFIARMPSGHRGVFKRQSRRRLPIVEQKIDITERAIQIFEKLIHGFTRAKFIEEFERDLARRLRRRG